MENGGAMMVKPWKEKGVYRCGDYWQRGYLNATDAAQFNSVMHEDVAQEHCTAVRTNAATRRKGNGAEGDEAVKEKLPMIGAGRVALHHFDAGVDVADRKARTCRSRVLRPCARLRNPPNSIFVAEAWRLYGYRRWYIYRRVVPTQFIGDAHHGRHRDYTGRLHAWCSRNPEVYRRRMRLYRKFVGLALHPDLLASAVISAGVISTTTRNTRKRTLPGAWS